MTSSLHLKKDDSCTIHQRNIQMLAIEVYKAVKGISPNIMSLILPLKEAIRYPRESIFKTRNIMAVRYGSDTIAHLGPKIWSILPEDLKQEPSLDLLVKKIKLWKVQNCPCRLCKTYISNFGFI